MHRLWRIVLRSPRMSRSLTTSLTFGTNHKLATCTRTSLTPFAPDPDLPHSSLHTFLDYASATNLSRSSTVFVGTRFEYSVQECMRRLGFTLVRCGGRSDAGIDLIGTWSPPLPISPPLHIKTLIQCKALSAGAVPASVRELEGASNGAPVGWRGSDVLALLAAAKPATKGVRDAIGRSTCPIGFVMILENGRAGQMIWNKAAEDLGIEDLGVGLRFWNGKEREIVLKWRGAILGDSLPTHEGTTVQD